MKEVVYQNGQEVIQTNLERMQRGKGEAITERLTDLFDNGILNRLSGTSFALSDNGDGTYSINVGVAYKDGERIEISDNSVDYDSTLPGQTTDDGIGGITPTPKSSGCANIPLVDGVTAYIGIKYLLYCDSNTPAAPTNYSLHPITAQRMFYKWEDGYELEFAATKIALSADSVYIGYVSRSGSIIFSSASDRSYTSIKSEVNVTAANVVDGAITESKIASGAVIGAKIATAVAGDGLSKDGSNNLKVNVDASTIEISSDILRVKDLGITSAKLIIDAVETIKIKDANVTAAKLATDAVEEAKIKDGAVTRAKIAADDVGFYYVTTPAIDFNTANFQYVGYKSLSLAGIVPPTAKAILINVGIYKAGGVGTEVLGFVRYGGPNITVCNLRQQPGAIQEDGQMIVPMDGVHANFTFYSSISSWHTAEVKVVGWWI